MKDEIERKIRLVDAEKTSFKRRKDSYPWPRAGLGGGGWKVFTKHQHGKGNVSMVPTFLDGKVRQRVDHTSRPGPLDPSTIKEDLKIYDVRQPKPRTLPDLHLMYGPESDAPTRLDEKPTAYAAPPPPAAPTRQHHRVEPIPEYSSNSKKPATTHPNQRPQQHYTDSLPRHRDDYLSTHMPPPAKPRMPSPPTSTSALPQRSTGGDMRPPASTWSSLNQNSRPASGQTNRPSAPESRTMWSGGDPRDRANAMFGSGAIRPDDRLPATHAPTGARWGYTDRPPAPSAVHPSQHPPSNSSHPHSSFGNASSFESRRSSHGNVHPQAASAAGPSRSNTTGNEAWRGYSPAGGFQSSPFDTRTPAMPAERLERKIEPPAGRALGNVPTTVAGGSGSGSGVGGEGKANGTGEGPIR